MWPVSSRYLDTLARSHTQLAYLEILQDGEVVTTLQAGSITDPTTGLQLSALGGSINVSSQTTRRSGTIQLLDPAGQLSPLSSSDLLAPYITEIRVWCGVRYWDATDALFGGLPWQVGVAPVLGDLTEFVPVATLIITEPELDDHQINITGYDRMWMLGNFPSTYVITSGTLITDAMQDLLAIAVPSGRLQINIPANEETVDGDALFDADSSIAEALQKLAAAADLKIACDPMGVFTGYSPVTTDQDADLTLTPGIGSVMMRPQRQIGSNEVYNAVILTNEGGSNTPLRGFALDTNPDSLTNVDRIGTRPLFMNDPKLSTQAQVDNAARNGLRTVLGISDAITIVMLPNHALEVEDVISITDPSQGLDGFKVLADNFVVPVRATDGVMTVQARANVILP